MKTVTNPSPVDIYVLCGGGGGGGKNNVPFCKENILFGQSLLYWPFVCHILSFLVIFRVLKP